MNRRRVTSIMLAAVMPVIAACGIPNDRVPTVTPGGVVAPVVAPSEPAVPSAPEIDVSVFLVRADHLVRVVRRAPGRNLTGVLALLLAGPKEEEFAAGTRTAVSPETSLLSARLADDTAVVDLSGSFVEVGGEEQILAVAQVVLTSTAVTGVRQVRFLLEGEAVDVPRADGTLTSDALRAEDYAGLLSPTP